MQEQQDRRRLPAGAEPPRPGDPASIGSYEVVGRLGEGGMGAVFLGRGTEGRMVAIKVIRPELSADHSFRDRFADEVGHARRVASFCTAAVLDHGEEDGRPYMVTEYVDGTPLEEYIEAQGALPPGTLHGVAVGVAAALTAIHAAGLIHRDLKPSNVLLSVSGPRVIDFGIARAADSPSQHTRAGFVIGSPGWMAPEQVLQSEVGTPVDIFAWGCLVAFAGLGRHPYGTGPIMAMTARAAEGDPDLEGLPEPLTSLVRRALAPAPGDRPSAQDLLLGLVGGSPADSRATSHAASPAASPAVPQSASAGGPGDLAATQAVASELIGRTWQAEALPPPWVPPSPPYGVPRAGAASAYPPPGTPPHGARGLRSGPPPAPPPAPISAQPVVAPPGPPPMMLPQYAPAAGQRPAPRPRRRRRPFGCLPAVLAVVALGLTGGFAVYTHVANGTGNGGDTGGDTNGTGTGRYGGRRPDARGRDGQFTFSVTRTTTGSPVQCGKGATVRGLKPSRGMFCLVRLVVTNKGKRPATLSARSQQLKGAVALTRGTRLLRGAARAANEVGDQTLAPGRSFTGIVVFDVTTGFKPAQLLLREKASGDGARFAVPS